MKNKEKGLFRNIVEIIILTLMLKGVGFINRIVIAFFYGTKSTTDMFYTMSGFIDGLYAIMLSGLTVGIVNIYIHDRDDKKKANEFISNLIVIVTVIMVFLLVVSLWGAGFFAEILAPGITTDNLNSMKKMLRLMSLVFPFQGLITVYSSLLQANKRFTPVKLTGTVISMVNIICVVFFATIGQDNALVWAYTLSRVANVLFLGICCRNTYHFKPKHVLKDERLKQLLVLAVPMMIGLAAHETNLVIDKSLATTLGEGFVSALSYSSVLYLFVEGVIINSVVTVLFPYLVQSNTSEKSNELSGIIQNILIFLLLILVPLVCWMSIFSKDIISIVYMRGEFNLDSLLVTNMAFCGLILGLPFLAVKDSITRVFYSYNNTLKPIMINMISIGINIALDFYLGKRYGIIGITLATSIANAFAAILLSIYVRKYNSLIFDRKLMKEIFIITCSILGDILVLTLINNLKINVFFKMTVSLIIIYCLKLILIKVFEFRILSFLKSLYSNIKKRS